jgi:nucleoside-diphosphate-sugar epimerase
VSGRVLVTGGGGFVGRPLLSELVRRGFDVHAVDCVARPHQAGVTWHRCDLLDTSGHRPLMDRIAPSHLMHLAWYVEHGRFWTAPENEIWRSASLDLVRAFAQSGGQRAVLVGSCAEYDWQRSDDVPWRESDPCRPVLPYGIAKHALHLDAAAKAARSGISFAWARLFLMFGEGENPRRLVPSVINALASGAPLEMSSGRQVRDFSDTRDIAAGLSALLAAGHVEGAVNVASGEGRSLRELCAIIADLAGRSGENLRFGALPDRDEPPFMVADVTRLREEVGFTPPESLRQRLSSIVRERLALSPSPVRGA